MLRRATSGSRVIIVLLVVVSAALLVACARAGASSATPDPNDPFAPPRGTLETTKSLDGTGFAGNQHIYRTTATTDEIVAYYQTQLPARGWTLLPDRSNAKAGQLTFQESDGKTTLGVVIEGSGTQRRVTVGVIVRP